MLCPIRAIPAIRATEFRRGQLLRRRTGEMFSFRLVVHQPTLSIDRAGGRVIARNGEG